MSPVRFISRVDDLEAHPDYFHDRWQEFQDQSPRLSRSVPYRHIACYRRLGFTRYIEQTAEGVYRCPSCKSYLSKQLELALRVAAGDSLDHIMGDAEPGELEEIQRIHQQLVSARALGNAKSR